MKKPSSAIMGGSVLAVCLVATLVGCDDDLAISGGVADIDCPSGVEQFWYVGIPEGVGSVNLDFTVDTVSQFTAFDPAARVYTLNPDGSIGAEVLSSDDDVPCTFPPPTFECPAGALNVTEDVVIGVRSLGSCAGSFGEYQVLVTGAEFVEPF